MTNQRIDVQRKKIAEANEYILKLRANLNLSQGSHKLYIADLKNARSSVRQKEENLKSNIKDINKFKRKIAAERRLIKRCEKKIQQLPSLIRSDTKKNIGKVLNKMFDEGQQ